MKPVIGALAAISLMSTVVQGQVPTPTAAPTNTVFLVEPIITQSSFPAIKAGSCGVAPLEEFIKCHVDTGSQKAQEVCILGSKFECSLLPLGHQPPVTTNPPRPDLGTICPKGQRGVCVTSAGPTCYDREKFVCTQEGRLFSLQTNSYIDFAPNQPASFPSTDAPHPRPLTQPILSDPLPPPPGDLMRTQPSKPLQPEPEFMTIQPFPTPSPPVQGFPGQSVPVTSGIATIQPFPLPAAGQPGQPTEARSGVAIQGFPTPAPGTNAPPQPVAQPGFGSIQIQPLTSPPGPVTGGQPLPLQPQPDLATIQVQPFTSQPRPAQPPSLQPAQPPFGQPIPTQALPVQPNTNLPGQTQPNFGQPLQPTQLQPAPGQPQLQPAPGQPQLQPASGQPQLQPAPGQPQPNFGQPLQPQPINFQPQPINTGIPGQPINTGLPGQPIQGQPIPSQFLPQVQPVRESPDLKVVADRVPGFKPILIVHDPIV